MRKNLIIVFLLITVAISLGANNVEAISPKLQAFLEDLENRVSQIEQFKTYQVVSDPVLLPPFPGTVEGSVECNNNDPVINASWDSDATKIFKIKTWKINGDRLEFLISSNSDQIITFSIFLTCKG